MVLRVPNIIRGLGCLVATHTTLCNKVFGSGHLAHLKVHTKPTKTKFSASHYRLRRIVSVSVLLSSVHFGSGFISKVSDV